MEPGKTALLNVTRKSDIGYILTEENTEQEVLLHFNDCAGKTPNIGERVEAFLYFDHKGRVAATLSLPEINAFNCGWAETVDVMPFGVYVNIGIRKDILLSGDDLPLNKKYWPQKGDKLYGYLVNDNNKGLLFRLGTIGDILEIKKAAPKELYGHKLTVTVIKNGLNGVNVISDEGYLGFIHKSEYKEEPHIGARVTARVIDVKSNNEINLSLKEQKEIAIKSDHETILGYLESHLGKMPLCDKSTPEEIEALLHISKAAFKRAMGQLIKENRITQDLERKITSLK